MPPVTQARLNLLEAMLDMMWERSYAAIAEAARRLNAASLSSQRAPSVPFARDVLFAKSEGEEEG